MTSYYNVKNLKRINKMNLYKEKYQFKTDESLTKLLRMEGAEKYLKKYQTKAS